MKNDIFNDRLMILQMNNSYKTPWHFKITDIFFLDLLLTLILPHLKPIPKDFRLAFFPIELIVN